MENNFIYFVSYFKRWQGLLFFLVISLRLAHGSASIPTEDIIFQKLTVDHGLSDLTVRSIIQDHEGYMWFGTNNGLNRYDGKEIVNYFVDRNDPHSLRGNIIYCLFEDSRNNLWVGTWGGGLSLYNRDQDNFLSFINDPADAGSISHNDIWHVFEDSAGRLWIATQKGLERFDYETYTFEKHLMDLSLPGESVNLKRKAFSCISEKADGTLWISIWKHGLLNYDQVNRKIIRHLVNEPGRDNSLSTSEINTLYTGRDGSLWAGTYKGNLERISMVNGLPVFESYSMGPAPSGLSDDRINFIIEDNQGNIWIGTEMGMNIMDKTKGYISHFFHDANTNNSLSSNHLWSGYRSSNGIIWIGSLEGGVNIYDPGRRKFQSNYPFINTAKEQPHKFVKSIYKDTKGILWVGTDSGLNKFSAQGEILTTYVHGNTDESLDIGGVSGIVEDMDGRLWVGTWGGGLHYLDPEKKVLKRYYQPSKNKATPRGISDLNIQTMKSDHAGNILIGTTFGYLYLFNPRKDTFQRFLCQDLDSLRGAPITAICPDKDGSVWIGLIENGGLIHLNPMTGEADRYFLKEQDKDYSLSSNDVFCLLDDDDHLWIGTKNGLNHLNKSAGTITVYDEKQGLSNKSVLSIQKDIEGNIWFSTPQGISKFDKQSGQVYNYDGRDGALGNCIVSWKGINPELYFGGINGIFSFNPLTIINNSYIPPVVFTSIRIYNETVYPNAENSPLEKHINQTDRIVLNHNQTSFSLEFAALNYTLPEKNQYRFKLEGFDPNWVHAGTRNIAYYTNVQKGTYTFKVQGSNNDGLWNEEARTLEIVILPPWWNTLWFKILILVFIIAVISLWIIIRTLRLKQQQKRLLKLVKERTREIEDQKVMIREQARKIHASDQLKIRFLTNISHEFRTPLSLIINPINNLINEFADREEYKTPFTVVKRNTLRLIALINQFLDISKIEAGELKLAVARGDIIKFVNDIFDNYRFAATKKNIRYNISIPIKTHVCYFDGDKIEKILYNLLSNALKFTPSGGEISAEVRLTSPFRGTHPLFDHKNGDPADSTHIEIIVKDTGAGIPEDKLEKIFERFYQIEGDKNYLPGGTGIGLSLTKDLVDIYRGKLEVKSKPHEGSEFKVLLPTDKNFFEQHEFVMCAPTHDELRSELAMLDEDHLDMHPADEVAEQQEHPEGSPLVLIVEDNREVRQYVASALKNKYNILQARDGVEGFKKALKHLPQLIISDVMMPKMDGFKLCEKVKNDMLTCHIPVILLTAKAANSDIQEGIETGADAYISKPFDVSILKATVDQLIETREKLKELFRRKLILEPKDVEITSPDEKLLKRIITVLDDKLSDPEFSVEQLGKEVGLSRTHLYRKIKSLTDMTAIEFIRNIRLEYAARLLQQNKLYVSEVAYMSGFKELSYFRKVFKEMYGMSPQEFAESKKVLSDDAVINN